MKIILAYFVLFSRIVLSQNIQLKDTTKFRNEQYNYGFQLGYNYRNISEFSLGLNWTYARNMYYKKSFMYIISYNHRKMYKPNLGLFLENTALSKLNSGLRIGFNYYHFIFISYQFTLPLVSDYDRFNLSLHSILINIKINRLLFDSMLISDNRQRHWNDR